MNNIPFKKKLFLLYIYLTPPPLPDCFFVNGYLLIYSQAKTFLGHNSNKPQTSCVSAQVKQFNKNVIQKKLTKLLAKLQSSLH